ncbi:hypothetical protein [Spirulina subsalsa]|uniref:hypothetical protein n=1 Tax=Spirulina subsalsa TaxID=54311 RepID=UPI0002F4E3B2|nr:hypothetical protein [Spirulina subsalsa]
MELFVQSCGVSKEYCWLKEPEIILYDLPDDDLEPMLKMVDSDYFSVVLYRSQDQQNRLLLLVTGLPSKDRIDNRTRKIFNSVLWVGNNSDEATLRAIAIQALNGELANRVDQAVVSENNAQGFKVSFEELTPENLGLMSVQNNPADSGKIGNLSICKNDLIRDLNQYSLPKYDGMLVVVSATVSESKLKQNKVWRGLSETISDDEWILLSEDKGDNFRQPSKSTNTSTSASVLPTATSSAYSRNGTGNQETSTLKKWLPIIVAFLIGLLISMAGHYIWFNFTENNLKQRIEELQKQRNDLQSKNRELSQQVEIKQKRIKLYEKFENDSNSTYARLIEQINTARNNAMKEIESSKEKLNAELQKIQIKEDNLLGKSS